MGISKAIFCCGMNRIMAAIAAKAAEAGGGPDPDPVIDDAYIMSLSPLLWLDADQPDAIYNSTSGGSPINSNGTGYRWQDRSGNNHHCSDSSGISLELNSHNGRRAVRFNGSQRLLNSSLVVPMQQFTIAVVYYQDVPVDYAGVLVIGPSGGGDDVLAPTKARIGPNTKAFDGGGGFGVSCNLSNSANKTKLMRTGFPGPVQSYVSVFDGVAGTISMYSNGILKPNVNSVNPGDVYSNTLINSDVGYLLGALYTGGSINMSYALNGRIMEVMIFGGALNPTQVSNVSLYQKTKWVRPIPAMPDLSAYRLAFHTHNGDGIPMNVYSDAAMTKIADQDGVSVVRIVCTDGTVLIGEVAGSMQYRGGIPTIRGGIWRKTEMSWGITEAVGACGYFSSTSSATYCLWDADGLSSSTADDNWDYYFGGAYLSKFRSVRVDNMFADTLVNGELRVDTVVSDSTEYSVYRNGSLKGTSTSGTFSASNDIFTIGGQNNMTGGSIHYGWIASLIIHGDTSIRTTIDSDAGFFLVDPNSR